LGAGRRFHSRRGCRPAAADHRQEPPPLVMKSK
jgi:hypothetical protein